MKLLHMINVTDIVKDKSDMEAIKYLQQILLTDDFTLCTDSRTKSRFMMADFMYCKFAHEIIFLNYNSNFGEPVYVRTEVENPNVPVWGKYITYELENDIPKVILTYKTVQDVELSLELCDSGTTYNEAL